jgi:tRNA threonylcarbamoyladenosine biosynthesis protein TsaE
VPPADVVTIDTDSPEATQAAAARLAALLRPGDLLCLRGDLGAGKTTFTRGLVAALGAPAQLVTSPTFTLLHEYRGGRLPVLHADAYRLTGAADDLDAVGLGEEIARAEAVVVLEWPERVEASLPGERLDVTLDETGGEQRRITLAGRGPRWADLAAEWGAVAC